MELNSNVCIHFPENYDYDHNHRIFFIYIRSFFFIYKEAKKRILLYKLIVYVCSLRTYKHRSIIDILAKDAHELA